LRPIALPLLLIAVLMSAGGCATMVLTGGVEPQAPPPRTEAALEQRVREALRDDGRVDATAIDVSAQEGDVTLIGQVPDRAAADRAVSTALSVDGVARIINRLSTPSGN
jgi:osmotically-inducible protein OsmY